MFQDIVNTVMGRYNKSLDEIQMASLFQKASSNNPLWLTVACEQLRHLEGPQMTTKIDTLQDGLLELVSTL